jgi:lipoyl-dependent peroxiredoxin
MKRKANAVWKGTGKEGTGHLTTQSTILDKTQYSANSRFAEGKGTNPEELVAAAHAGCYAMKLAFVLNEAGFTADEINSECVVNFENGSIIESALKMSAKVPGISKEKFQECADNAKANCPISKSINAKISLDASLL